MLKRLESLGEERGTTLVELTVAMAAGIIVMATLSLVIVIVLHGSARVSARVEATQSARIAVTRIIEQLHSACVAPKAAPVLEQSTGTNLRFIHAVGSQTTQVAPVPTKTEIKYSGGTLTQYDYAGTGYYPNTTYSGTATATTLATRVAPIAPSSAVFTYFGSSNGALTEVVPGSGGLTNAQASSVIEVRVGLNASPKSAPVADAGSATAIRDSSQLRLTPPSYNEKATAPACQ
jgi:Tfp pilus assembly protein PilW